MDDLISREAAVEMLREKAKGYFVSMFATSSDCYVARVVAMECAVDIKDMPAVDAEPVRHGRWVKDKESNTYCSVCDCYIPAVHCRQDYQDDFSEWDEEIDETDYCPNCGAKMDAKEA